VAGPEFAHTIGRPYGAPQPEAEAPPNPLLWLVAAAAIGAMSAWLAGAAPPERASQATFDLERDLAKATVAVARPGGVEPCQWVAADHRFRCSDDIWAFVGPYGGHSAGAARRCTWAHPVGPGVATVLTWPNQTFGSQLSLAVGLVDGAGAGTPVEVQVFAAGTSIGQASSVDARELGVADLPVPPGPLQGELRIEVRTRDHSVRMACIDVRMRGERLAPQPSEDKGPPAGPAPRGGTPR